MQADFHLPRSRPYGAAGPPHLELTLPADADAPARARAGVARALDRWSRERREVALLIVSELVTNAVRHGSCGPEDPIEVRLDRRGRTARIEVADRRTLGGSVESARRGADGNATAGWGLPIVTELTDRWGVEADGSSTRVWCELEAV